jgi:hypothetical protein
MIIGDNAYETVPGWLGTPLVAKGELERPLVSKTSGGVR